MVSEERTIEARFDMKRPGEVSFTLPVRVPDADWAATSLSTLRKVHGINQIKCQPNSYKLEAVIARSDGVVELLAEVIMTIIELMDAESVREIAIKANRSQTSMLSADHLDQALRQIAIKEWTHFHTLSIKMARDGQTELDQRIQTLRATETDRAADESRIESELNGVIDALEGARQSYRDSRHADLHDDELIKFGKVVSGFADEADTLRETLATTRADLTDLRSEIAVLTGLLDEAKMKIEGIEKLTCPRYKVAVSKRGKNALFALKARLGGDGDPEGEPGTEADDVPDDVADTELSHEA